VKRNGRARRGNQFFPIGPMTLAICVSWGVFCEYWDDFCYPASDDVAIWPLSQEWFLIYDHSEKFFFVRCGR